MSITLTSETQARLQERAARSGQDPSALAEAVLTAYLENRIEMIPPGVLSIADDDLAAIDAAIAVAEEDFSAGRFTSLEEWRLKKRSQFGLAL